MQQYKSSAVLSSVSNAIINFLNCKQMFKNYFKTALRSLRSNAYFAFTNVLGLCIGISAALVIYLAVKYDFSFDRFEKNNERIYRLVTDYTFSNQPFYDSGVPAAMPDAIKKEVTGLDFTIPFRTWGTDTKVRIPNGESFTEYKNQKNIVFADENYFRLLSYKWITGQAATAVNQPYQVVLTATSAQLYFPSLRAQQVIGHELILNDSIRTTVTGIVNDLQYNTDFGFNVFVSRVSMETARLKPDDGDEWGSASPASQLFVKLAAGNQPAQVAKQINALFKKYYKNTAPDVSITYQLQPLSDLHFNTRYENFGQRIAHRPTLYGLIAIAIFLLSLACINFINLTTAQGARRAKEIGIRKTMGSSKKQLVLQFLSETFLVTIIASLLSLALAPLLLKAFSSFLPPDLHFALWQLPEVLLFLVALIVLVSLLAGFYPAWVLSSYKPVSVLKANTLTGNGSTSSVWWRKTLTVTQFIIAQVFIIATLLVSKQINYTLHKDLGFQKNNIVYFDTGFKDQNPAHRALLANNLKNIPGIAKISISNNTPSLNSKHYPASIFSYTDGTKEIKTQAEIKYADSNYIDLYEMKLLAGAKLPSTDTVKTIVINKTFAQAMGFTNPQEAIGKYIKWENKHVAISGVIADFHQKSLYEPIKPVVIASRVSQELMINVALQPTVTSNGSLKATIDKIEKSFKEIFPEEDFAYSFMDQSIEKYYTAEQNSAHLLMWATGLTVLISCMGLLGLATYITNQRTKEIGIRKVIGATVAQLVYLLSKDFLKLVLWAFLVAVPLAWWGTQQWLNNFAYKTTISWWIFLSGGLLMLAIALLVLCMRTVKAANANPVKSLKAE